MNYGIINGKFFQNYRVRYIINNYYNESFLEIFDKALNLNLRLYIQNKKNKFSLKEIKQLMSKLFSL